MTARFRRFEEGRAVIGAVKKMSKCGGAVYSPPCITARRGGCVINKISRSYRNRRRRGGFPPFSQSENHPSSHSVEASRHLLDRSATPPCCGARRGILLDSNSFTPSMTAYYSLNLRKRAVIDRAYSSLPPQRFEFRLQLYPFLAALFCYRRNTAVLIKSNNLLF